MKSNCAYVAKFKHKAFTIAAYKGQNWRVCLKNTIFHMYSPMHVALLDVDVCFYFL